VGKNTEEEKNAKRSGKRRSGKASTGSRKRLPRNTISFLWARGVQCAESWKMRGVKHKTQKRFWGRKAGKNGIFCQPLGSITYNRGKGARKLPEKGWGAT